MATTESTGLPVAGRDHQSHNLLDAVLDVPSGYTWVLQDDGYEPVLEHEIESRFAVANGSLGIRGFIEQPTLASRPRTYIAGLFESPDGVVLTLSSSPDRQRLRIGVNDQPLSLLSGTTLEHRRTLDLRRGVLLSSVVLLLLGMVACTDDADGPAPEFALRSSPEFVNRLIPGHRPVALVTASGEAGARVDLEATTSLAGAAVALEPASLAIGDVSEVWIDIPEVAEEVAFTVTVTGHLGSTERAITISATAVPGSDDIESTALEIAGFFLRELIAEAPELPDETAGLVNGTPVAGLLVVTHYAWFTAEYEIGLQWHIMLAPDDFAEFYVRPRDELRPTRAFRVNSWSMALEGGAFTLTEVAPPAEVTR